MFHELGDGGGKPVKEQHKVFSNIKQDSRTLEKLHNSPICTYHTSPCEGNLVEEM